MIKIKRAPAILLLGLLLLTLTSCFDYPFDVTVLPEPAPAEAPVLTHILHPDAEVRGVWIASVYNIDYPSSPDLSAEQLKAEIDAILDTCEKNGLNTVFFQVRPSCDALYKSELFPVSSYLSQNGNLTFDPLAYIVEAGHQRNIRIHAWVNPLRVTMGTQNLDDLPHNSPARQHPEWVVPYADGKLYLDAGIPEVRQYVADGVREIVKHYDVDGVVFDDYFYPYPAYGENGMPAIFDDADTFAAYGKGFDNLADWRRNNVNEMVRLCYETVHAADAECVFGISPFAIWQNNNGQNGGSNTQNMEAYHDLYCDALAWIEGGYVDYLSPQIYWTFDTASSPYDVVLRWWNQKLDGTGVKLYVSHASYRYEEGEWADPAGELGEQIQFARSEKSYYGSIFYGYDEIKRNIRGASDELIRAYDTEILYTDIHSTGLPVTFSSPRNGTVMTTPKTYVIGMADPYYPLTLDGERVSCTKSGYFNLFVELKEGVNTFVFEQNGQKTTYTLTYRPTSGGQSTQASAPPILDTLSVIGLYPSEEAAIPDDTLWVSCVAPYGSRVSVNIGGVITELPALETPANPYSQSGYVGVTYGAYAALPPAAEGEILDCGTVRYTVQHGNGTVTADSIPVRRLGAGAMLCVRATEDYAELKITPSSSYYNDYTVQSAGMTDYAIRLRNGFYELRMGGFIAASQTEEITATPADRTTILAADVTNSGKTTDIRLTCEDRPAYNGAVEDGRFVLTLYGIDGATAPVPVIGNNPLLRSCEVIRGEDRVQYAFDLVAVENFYGFDLRYEENATVVSLRNPKSVDLTSATPLTGIRMVLDAGHGGWDNGAAGAFFTDSVTAHEKDLNLFVARQTAKRLTELGAEVILTRSDDTAMDLYQRIDFLEQTEPDLCLSIHQNSMDYSTDVTRIRGTLGLYCMDGGYLLADSVGRSVASVMGRRYIGTQYQMLAMCRNPKFPAALIEVGFMTSVEEYEQIFSQRGMERAADSIAEGVLAYFRRQAQYLG